MTTALAGLPDAVLALLPGGLDAAVPPEVLATCGDCAMKPRPGVPETSWAPVFPAASRCCTYHPELPNVLVGRALNRSGPGADAIRARLADPDGVSAWGIRPPKGFHRRYHDPTTGGFGHDDALRCPYWSATAPEGRGCTIHLDREAVCRTWHCRLGSGRRSYAAWMAVKALLDGILHTIATRCALLGEAPADGAPPAAWEAWFRGCADRVDRWTAADVDGLRGGQLDQLAAAVTAAVADRDRPMPEVVMPSVTAWNVHPHGVSLVSWSRCDPVEAPPWVFRLLARLDGQTPWRRAKAETEAELGQPIGDDWVVTLYRRGLLGPPEYVDVEPGLSVFPHVVLRGT
ncbi:MAG: hypothetical protein ABMB14_13705 [Myxococcota bacterium]